MHIFTYKYGEYIYLIFIIEVYIMKKATSIEFDQWQEKELNWWADKQLNFVAVATLIQLSALGFMFLSFYLLSIAFS